MQENAALSDKTSILAQFADDPRRIGAAIVLGFSTGLPFLLVYSTQSAWLYEANVPIETIGLLSEMTLAYKFKWVWAPFLDELTRRSFHGFSDAAAAGSSSRRSS